MPGNHKSGLRPTEQAIRKYHEAEARRGITPGLPDVPEWLEADSLAIAYFTRQGAALVLRGVLTPEYGDVLANLASITAQLHRAIEAHAADGHAPTITGVTSRGVQSTLPHPLVRQIADLRTEQRKCLFEFGLTPATAARILAVRADTTDSDEFDWAEFDAPEQ